VPEPTECAFGRRSTSSATLWGLNPDGEWSAIKDRFTDNGLGKWASYAPNMTAENVIATRVRSPDIERGLNLGIGRGSSYNCYQEIARALRLERAAVGAR
jgi:hypothetical protein